MVREAVACLELIARERQVEFAFETHLLGGAAVDATGDPFPAATEAVCLSADAVLLGAVGGPTWDKLPAHQRPESGLLRLRQALAASPTCAPWPSPMP